MNPEEERKVRKPNRLEAYDYRTNGYYFLTICTQDRRQLLWEKDKNVLVGERTTLPQSTGMQRAAREADSLPYGGTGARLPHGYHLTNAGMSVLKAILEIPKHYGTVKVEHFAIMPNHVHLLLLLDDSLGKGCNPAIPNMIGQMKIAVTRKLGYSLWQRSYHDHIVRDQREFEMIWSYIDENPLKWSEDRYYEA